MRFYLLLFSILLASCNEKYYNYDSSSYDNVEEGMPSEPGKCYAKCLIPEKGTEKLVGEFLVFTGENTDVEGVVYREIVTREKGSKWEKKKADRNCLSSNPEDCQVWCLVETPKESVEFFEVIDTNLVKEFKKEEIYTKYIDQKSGFTQWKEVVCEKDVTKKLLNDIQQNLSLKGYPMEESKKGKFDEATKAALKNFQKDYDLPIGSLNIETMEALGVEY